MSSHAPHPSLYLLADHLDAALASGEDMLACKVDLAHASGDAHDMDAVAARNGELAQFLSQTRLFELSLIARLLQARRWAEDVRRSEVRLKPILQLFIGGTAPLVDAAQEMGDTTNRSFETGDTMTSFLRERGIVAWDAAGIERRTLIAVTDDFLVAGRIRLGTLLDLVSAFLDTLDLMADLRISQAPAMEAAAIAPQ